MFTNSNDLWYINVKVVYYFILLSNQQLLSWKCQLHEQLCNQANKKGGHAQTCIYLNIADLEMI